MDLSQLSPDQIQALRQQVSERALKASQEENLADFIKGGWHILEPSNPLQWNWHLSLICAYLEKVSSREIKRLICNIPPGTMKSLIVSVFWPAWTWATDSSHRFLCGSNDESLALRDAVKMRQLVTSEWFQTRWGDKVTMDRQQDEKGLFANENRGHRQSQSMTSSVTGKRGQTLIIDDPHDAKNLSDVKREQVLNAWREGWTSRMNNPNEDAIVVIMQRLHSEDLTGYLLSLKKEPWIHLIIPMRYEGESTFDAGKDINRPDLFDPRTYPGELMFESRVDEVAALAQEEQWGPYNTAGQYQQRPSPKGGGELRLDWLMTYKTPPKRCNKIILVDPAGERKPGVTGKRDNTAMGVFGKGQDDQYYLIDGVRDRLNLVERTELLFEWHHKYKPKGVGYEQYGAQSDIAHIQAEMEVLDYRFKIIELGGSLKKEDRIRRLIPLLSQGKIWLPERLMKPMVDGTSRDIIADLIEVEYSHFPVSKWDDFLDMMSRICDDEMKIIGPMEAKPMPTFKRRAYTDSGVGY